MRGRLPHVAAITMVRDEGPMLRKWVDHYGAQLGLDHLVVVDDNSVDGSTDDLPCRVVRIPPIVGHFERERIRTVSDLARKLLRRHAAVVFADADEFIVADPDRYDGLRDLVAVRRDREAVGEMALNVVHDLATEGALDLARPVLQQRRHAIFVPLMCKPAVKLTKAPWAAASHGLRGATFQVDPDLYMFHLKFADRELLADAAGKRRAMVEHDGRAAASSWQFTGDEMVDLLIRVNQRFQQAADVPVFEPPLAELAAIPKTFDNGVTRATGPRQVEVMESGRVQLIPERFASLV
jgi:hypothetical protein